MIDADEFDDDEQELSDGEETSPAIFEGDISELFPEQRRCLHKLLKHRYLSAENNPKEWEILISNTDLIRSRLNDIFLDLHLDRERQIAFKRQATAGTDPLPTLLRTSSHTKEETIVMMFLRREFHLQCQNGEENVYIDRERLLAEVAQMRPEDATNRALDQSRTNKAIESLIVAQVLLRTKDPDRFRISPIVEVLLSVEKLESLYSWLLQANQGKNYSEIADGVNSATNTEVEDNADFQIWANPLFDMTEEDT